MAAWRYTGDGNEYYMRVPMRDLSAEEFDALADEDKERVQSGIIYEEAGGSDDDGDHMALDMVPGEASPTPVEIESQEDMAEAVEAGTITPENPEPPSRPYRRGVPDTGV